MCTYSCHESNYSGSAYRSVRFVGVAFETADPWTIILYCYHNTWGSYRIQGVWEQDSPGFHTSMYLYWSILTPHSDSQDTHCLLQQQ